jgi:hypothetical protein
MSRVAEQRASLVDYLGLDVLHQRRTVNQTSGAPNRFSADRPQQRLLGSRQFCTVIAAREQVAVGVGGHHDG